MNYGMRVRDIVQETGIKTIPMERNGTLQGGENDEIAMLHLFKQQFLYKKDFELKLVYLTHCLVCESLRNKLS